METDSGVESAETLPSGTEIITTKTEMDNESWKRLTKKTESKTDDGPDYNNPLYEQDRADFVMFKPNKQ